MDRDHGNSGRVMNVIPASAKQAERLPVLFRSMGAFAFWGVLAALLAFSPASGAAQEQEYLGKNRLEFQAIEESPSPDAAGTGIVDYKGGAEPDSQWRATFRFTGLEEKASYTVVVRGRFGDRDSPEAETFTPLCSFSANEQGKGSCFWYFRGLARLNLVQLRIGDEDGSRVLQASRSGDLGTITTQPNRFSPGGEISAMKQSQRAKRSH